MTDTTKRVILPAEATEEMMLAGMASAEIMATATQGDAHIEGYAAMRDAAPNAGKVTEAQLNAAYAAAKEVCEGCTSNFCGDCDCDGFTCREGIRAALSALGLEVE